MISLFVASLAVHGVVRYTLQVAKTIHLPYADWWDGSEPNTIYTYFLAVLRMYAGRSTKTVKQPYVYTSISEHLDKISYATMISRPLLTCNALKLRKLAAPNDSSKYDYLI